MKMGQPASLRFNIVLGTIVAVVVVLMLRNARETDLRYNPGKSRDSAIGYLQQYVANEMIADATCRDDRYDAASIYIPYGGDQVKAVVPLKGGSDIVIGMNRKIRHQIEFEVWAQSPICR